MRCDALEFQVCLSERFAPSANGKQVLQPAREEGDAAAAQPRGGGSPQGRFTAPRWSPAMPPLILHDPHGPSFLPCSLVAKFAVRSYVRVCVPARASARTHTLHGSYICAAIGEPWEAARQ